MKREVSLYLPRVLLNPPKLGVIIQPLRHEGTKAQIRDMKFKPLSLSKREESIAEKIVDAANTQIF